MPKREITPTDHQPASAAEPISRRRFAQWLALGSTATAVSWLPATASAQAAAPAPPPAPQAASAASAASAATQAKVDRVLAEFGSRLSDAQKQRLPSIIAGHDRMLAVVNAFALENGDAPATVLRAEVPHVG